ncbi:MAG: bifunctional phosphopantothenoylcysteine decarboxylase/phosphopantothenate--cysteine ligase CoaBC [Sphingobacteriia bacterium]|nr:MAG: bifunctional phosphopantothenoylcysteine decarboxylase/phosphopantothenate--cysteine ligase CoaBC [Sphingobacteriia bacterium]
MLSDKKILVGITGSIAAYKSILLIRLLVKAGAEVKVVMTPSAKSFVSPLVLSTLCKNSVFSELVESDQWANHVELGRWADLFIIAPLSCNTLAKMANGLCDNILQAVYLSATCAVVVAPAMDEDMWHHLSTKKNLSTLLSYGNTIIPVGKGELASGLFGEGRMAEPEEILQFCTEAFFRGISLSGKKVLVTAGPTYESIDPVRFIGNYSSGKMGFAIAESLYMAGAEVLLITGPSQEQLLYKGIKILRVISADEMYESAAPLMGQVDIAVYCAAVADFTPSIKHTEKIKKHSDHLLLELQPTIDILAMAGAQKKTNQYILGFALETENEKENALAKLKRKNIDAIVLNSLRTVGAGFGVDTNDVTILSANGVEKNIALQSKKSVAAAIVSFIIDELYA